MLFSFFGSNEKEPRKDIGGLNAKLETALKQLLTALETNGMKFLIDKMGSEEVYADLILERRKIEMSYSSTDTVAWYAYRQSEKLTSAQDKNELLDLLSDPAFEKDKKYIYCCLSSICYNTNDRDLFNFLVSKLPGEDDESIRVSILSRLREMKKDDGFHIDYIKVLVKEGTYNESHAAIKALSYTNDPEVEDLLLDEFKIADKHMKGMICRPLSTVATEKSIPVLKAAYKKTRDGFLRAGIEEVFKEVESRADKR